MTLILLILPSLLLSLLLHFLTRRFFVACLTSGMLVGLGLFFLFFAQADFNLNIGSFVGLASLFGTPFAISFVVGLPFLLVRWNRISPYGQRECTICGYDLRGNQSGICPECGTVIPGEQQATIRSENSVSDDR